MFTSAENIGWKQRIVLESVTVLFFLSKNAVIPLVQQKYNATEFSDLAQQDGCQTSSDVMKIRAEIHEKSSLTVMYLNIAELLPSAVVVLFMGFWSDVSGKRKFLMWLPCLGNAIYALGFIMTSYMSEPENAFILMYVTTFMSGLSGNIPGFLSGNACYISDTDTAGRRTLRLSIVELAVGLTFAVGNICVGYWISTAGFTQPLWFVFVLSVAALLLVVFGLNEPNQEMPGRVYHWRDLKPALQFIGCSRTFQKKLWAITIAFMIYVFVQQGQERTFVLFLQHSPLCWGAVQIGLFYFTLMLLGGVGCYPGIPLLSRWLTDLSLTGLALVSKAAGSFVLAFAASAAPAYISCVVQIFHLYPYAVARSIASRQVGSDEQGVVYAMLHSGQSLFAFLGPVTLNGMYAATFELHPGLVFLVSGALLILPLLLLGWIYVLDNKDESYLDIDTSDPEERILSPALSESSSLDIR